MKLNYKRTILVGFAFFLICTFWQAYDTIIPKILTDKFGMSQANSGIIMALDNILALFMLPLFGAISDKCTSRLGRRTPFILIGTIAAAVALIALSFTDGMQLKNIEAVSAIDDRAALETLYDSVSGTRLEMPDGTEFVLSETFSRGDFASITSQVEVDGAAVTNPDYTNYVVPARHAYAHAATRANPLPLILFIGILLVALISMATFRSPAVALMPDVTIKPLRSKANAIINLMGTAGGILVLGMGVVFGTGAAKNALMPYATFFSIVAGIMLLALLAFMLTVREPKFVREMEAESRRFHIDELPEGETGKDAKRPLSKEERASLLLILASVVFWFMGYNAVISKYSVYAGKVLDLDYNTPLLLANHRGGCGLSARWHDRLKNRAEENDPCRHRDACDLVWRGLLLAGGKLRACDELHVRTRGHWLGNDQRQQFPDGSGAFPRRRRRQIHRLLLHRQHGSANHNAILQRPFDG